MLTHTKTCQTQSSSSSRGKHEHMPYNAKMHGSTLECTHACWPAAWIQSPSDTHTHTHRTVQIGSFIAGLCVFLLSTHTNRQTTSFTIKQRSRIPCRPDSFTPYSIQQPGTDKPDRTDTIDWLKAVGSQQSSRERLTRSFVMFTK